MAARRRYRFWCDTARSSRTRIQGSPDDFAAVTWPIVIVTTPAGRLEGIDRDDVGTFLGIPYAEPPVGVRRWQPPEPAVPWTGTRSATLLPPGPPQPDSGTATAATLPGTDVERTDEDCLYLNVWAPTEATSAPVMVWLPGGGFVSGGAGIPLYDGTRLSTRFGIVVVTVTYRVGALGFAALPGTTPNRGLLDQVAALRWVRDSIDAFGGDPGNVTVFGESAGGGSVVHQLAMPSAHGLFRRAIVQSGATDHTLTADQAASVAERFSSLLGHDLGAPVDRVIGAQHEATLAAMAEIGPMPFHPFVDGGVIASRPIGAMPNAGVDLLIGTTRDEMRMYLDPRPGELDRDRVVRRVRRYLASLGAADDGAESLVERYDDDPHLLSGVDTWSAIQTDGEMRRPADAMIEAHAKGGETFVYRFDQRLAGRLAHLWACHASDLPFAFGTADRAGWSDVIGPGAARLSDAMQAAWVAFARAGDPSCEEVGEWPIYDVDRRATMLLDSESHVVYDPDGPRRRRWAELVPMVAS
jgi:para-nitrobenzyl esterase